MEVTRQEEVKEVYVFLFLGFLTLLVMCVMASNNSPLIQHIGADSGIYLLIGKNLTQGGVLYKDLFDHKGPIIFFLNALPQLFIKGPTGVWGLEVVCMFVSVMLIYEIAYKVLKNQAAILIPMVYLWLTSSLMNGGSYTEEYSNLFAIVSLYIFADWVETQDQQLYRWQAYVLGLCTSIVFFMKPNNIAVIVAVILCIGVLTLYHAPRKAIAYSAYGVLGLLTIVIPLLVYHYSKHTLVEMFNATLLHNLRYSKVGLEGKHWSIFLDSSFKVWRFGMFAVIAYGFIRCQVYKDRVYAIFLALSAVLTFISVGIGGRDFRYYLVIAVPLVSFALICVMKHGTTDLKRLLTKRLPVFIAVLLLIMAYRAYGAHPIAQRDTIVQYKQDIIALAQHIPDDEKTQVFGYDTPAMWFYESGITPMYHYFTMQSWMAKSDPSITENINAFVLSTKPKWIVTYDELAGTNPVVLRELAKNYEPVAQNSSGYLYRRK
jgi:hypothetical protein